MVQVGDRTVSTLEAMGSALEERNFMLGVYQDKAVGQKRNQKRLSTTRHVITDLKYELNVFLRDPFLTYLPHLFVSNLICFELDLYWI